MTYTKSLPNLFPMPAVIAKMVEQRMMRNLRRYAEFEFAVNSWYRDGDGRSVLNGGKGYRYPAACIHGADAWVDYDNICGPCEGGYGSWDYARELEEAYREAMWVTAESKQRWAKAGDFLAEARDLSHEGRQAIVDWAMAPVSRW